MPEQEPEKVQELPQQNIIALVYDFDGTLSPQPMQEYTVLPEIDMDANKFWDAVQKETDRTKSEKMLVYMRMLVEAIEAKRIHISRDKFTAMGGDVEYFQGVNEWFDNINAYVEEISNGRVELRHYIISAGLKEILDGVTIENKFHKIYASEYHYDHHGRAVYPKLLITDTSKTQFLFRINKGKEDVIDPINDHMSEDQRPIPFSNIIYIGDGDTDVPSMAVVKKNGGHALAVYDSTEAEKGKKGYELCCSLLKSNRIDFFAEADYRENENLDRVIKLILEYVVKKIEFNLIVNQGENQ